MQILYSYFTYTGRLFRGCAVFVARCNIIRGLREIQEGIKIELEKKKYIEEFFVKEITFLTARPPFYVALFV